MCLMWLERHLWFRSFILSILSSALLEEELEGGDSRTVLNLPPALAPYKAAIFH